jgi:predicted RNA binding protein YcfA (HicA-like mRNA interferase family)
MPKLPALTPAVVIRLLEQHGFVLDRQSGSHRVFVNGATKRRVVVPYHRKDLPRGTLVAILKAAEIYDVLRK